MRDIEQRPSPGTYAENRLLLTGRPAHIDEMLKRIKPGADLLDLRREIAIAELAPPKHELPGLEHKRRHVIRIYGFNGDVSEPIARINRVAAENKLDVAADFDHLISATPWTAAGSPWTAAGSPWTAAGSPWTAAGSPWTAAGSPWQAANGEGGAAIREQARRTFYSQWAFSQRGLQARVGPDAPANAGKGVRVGIFDTSPFPVTFSHADFDLDPDLHLTLTHPIPGGMIGGCGPGPAADHGLFIAGLIHALAPHRDIRLIRVLDDAAQGLMSILLGALQDFIRDTAHESELQGAVINLSLGLTASSEDATAEPTSLRLLLDVADALGMVVVAAAGNDSAPTPGSRPPQIPAAWDTVIGVAACNYDRKLACFSNAGDILAPGGGGLMPACLPGLNRCRGTDCRYALISLSTASWTGFSYGVGSSYAAPLVSGMAARLLSHDGPAPGAQIRPKILAQTAGDGIASGQGIP